jgi:hypothetical protein
MNSQTQTPRECACHPDSGFNSHFPGCPLYDETPRATAAHALDIKLGSQSCTILAYTLERESAAKDATIAELRAALKRHGQHDDDCFGGQNCSCGLTKALT